MGYQTVEGTQHHPIKMWTNGVPVEPAAVDQLRNLATLPFIHHHVAAMPDVHLGIGATVGSVIATRGAIVPAAVGVDIGCGMTAVQTSLSAAAFPDSLRDLRSTIEALVPVGKASHEDGSPYRDHLWAKLDEDYRLIEDRHPKIAPRQPPALQLGTLGGGNHFIEICLDEANAVWLMLHSGSRGIGNKIGTFFIARTREEMLRQNVHLPDRDLAYLTEDQEVFDEYLTAVSWAQEYAALNRQAMVEAVLNAMRATLPPFFATSMVISCHHNYVAREHHLGQDVWVTRKGAVRAGYGDLGIIPGSMGTRSYIVRGKGNPESFESCSHGAGRRMSRSAAKKLFTVEDHAMATRGIECRKDEGVLDETPAAYKDIDAVMAAQGDLVEVVHTLRQVLCVKG